MRAMLEVALVIKNAFSVYDRAAFLALNRRACHSCFAISLFFCAHRSRGFGHKVALSVLLQFKVLGRSDMELTFV